MNEVWNKFIEKQICYNKPQVKKQMTPIIISLRFQTDSSLVRNCHACVTITSKRERCQGSGPSAAPRPFSAKGAAEERHQELLSGGSGGLATPPGRTFTSSAGSPT